MSVIRLEPGDTILANKDIYNDGSFPGYAANELIVKEGTRGVIINQGHLEEDERQEVFLVKFEDETNPAELGPPIGCWTEDIKAIADIQ